MPWMPSPRWHGFDASGVLCWVRHFHGRTLFLPCRAVAPANVFVGWNGDGYGGRVAEKAIIGWTEYVDLPEWGIKGLKAKVDTGARTSALHVEDLVEHDDGWVTFDVMLHRRQRNLRRHVRARVVKNARVRSSTGHHTERCFVRTRLRIGPIEREIELSLVSRHTMLFRMLLGRTALAGDFWVDVSRRTLLTQRPDKVSKKQTSHLQRPSK